MSSTPFGDHLKREREMRGVTLEEISAATRIATRFLAALESEDWAQLPGGVFNRGFIRSMARFLGLDEDSLIAEYELETKQDAETRPAGNESSKISHNWRPAAVALAVFVAVVAVGGLAYHHRMQIWQHLHKARHAAPAATMTTAPNPTPPNGPQSSAPSSSSDAAQALTLKIQAAKPADVKVVADGATVFDGHVNPDDVRTFEAHEGFEVTSSDSSAVLLELNGRPVPPMGAPGQPGSVTLAGKDLNPDAGGAH